MSKKELEIKEPTHPLYNIYKIVGKLSGSDNVGIGKTFYEQLSRACRSQMDFVDIINNLKEIAPRDHIEGMLAVQMIATHNMMVECFTRTVGMFKDGDLEIIKLGNDTLNSANKLARTYTMQMEALNRYRAKGQQKMTVEHVHINSGGQAIIGNVNSNKKAS
jgi:hypothetical protein